MATIPNTIQQMDWMDQATTDRYAAIGERLSKMASIVFGNILAGPRKGMGFTFQISDEKGNPALDERGKPTFKPFRYCFKVLSIGLGLEQGKFAAEFGEDADLALNLWNKTEAHMLDMFTNHQDVVAELTAELPVLFATFEEVNPESAAYRAHRKTMPQSEKVSEVVVIGAERVTQAVIDKGAVAVSFLGGITKGIVRAVKNNIPDSAKDKWGNRVADARARVGEAVGHIKAGMSEAATRGETVIISRDKDSSL